MNAVKREIETIAPDSLVRLIQYDHKFRDEVVTFRPDVMMTFPMTSVGLAAPYYVFKHKFRTKVVCFRAEGIIDPGSPYSVSSHVGYDKYGPELVDCEIFWGPGPAKLIGDALLLQRKISSPDRLKCFGYPRLERYFGVQPAEGANAISESLALALDSYGRDRSILVATGFHFANYTREMIFAAKDLDAENRSEELLGIIEEVKRFRRTWIEGIRQAAKDNPDLLFILKKHPIERKEDYLELEGITNVLYVWQDVDLGDLIERVSLFFHYGSTSLADAYLAKVPAVYMYSAETRCRNWFPDMGWPSALSIRSDQFVDAIGAFRAGNLKFDQNSPAVKTVLEFNFNIRDGGNYRPSRNIAELLLNDEPPQTISVFDPYMWRAHLYHYYLRLRRTFGRPIKRMLRAARRLIN